MQGRSSKFSTTLAALLIVTVALASSTAYLVLVAYQPRHAGSASSGALQNQENSGIPSYEVAADSAQTGSDSSSANSITVSGSGQVSYTPNEALVQVSVQTNNSTAEAATSTNAQKMASVIRALNGIGVSNSSIETQGYNLYANYANCYSSCVPQIIGYSVTNSLQVNITSNDPTELGLRAGQVIDTSVKAGANGISLSFAASNSILAQLTNEALRGAVASAAGQAQAIADSLGVSISGVISASEGGSSYAPVEYYGVAMAAVSTATSAQTPISVGTQTVSATVQVVYSIS